jgi:deoxyribose-phosphate aldolase
MATREQVARAIDHAVLKPFATDEDIRAGCRLCARHGIGCFCVRPTDVALAAAELAGSPTAVAAVVGFPHGSNRPEVKALEARLAIADGARELDMVMNIGRFLAGDREAVQRDIEAVVAEAKPHGVVVKVILETCYLAPEQIDEACHLAAAAGADFAKTSTGFGESGATPEAVARMIAAVGGTLQVKASGGIKTWEQAVAYLEQGCTRLGVGASEAVLAGGD